MFFQISKKNTNKLIFIFAALTIFTIYQLIFLTYLDLGKYHFDYQSALSRLIFGKIWFLKNGLLDVPWFTPHICCGAPYYANPQSEFYSPIQFLFLFLKPLTTFKIFFVFYSFISFLGSFLVLRKIFKLSYYASLIGSTIFLFNHYFAFHFLSGHIGWGLFAIVPLFFYVSAISLNQTSFSHSFLLIVISSIIFAIMMHSGGTRIVMEILVSIYFLTLLHLVSYKNLKIIFNVGLSVFIGLLISSSKIYAAWSFVENLSRDVEPIYFTSIGGFISVFLDFFFLIPNENVTEHFGSQVAVLSIEEFSFNISIVPLIVLFFYLRNLPEFTDDRFKLFFGLIIISSVFILILLNFSNTFIGSLVRKIPFITNDWISFRMLAPLIILFSMLTAMIFDKINFKKIKLVTIIFISLVIIQNISFDRNKLYKIFVHTALKDLFNYNITKDNVDEFNIDEIITVLNKNSKFDGPAQHDFFLDNQSIQFCYFSMFGYGLEILKPIVKDLIFNKNEKWLSNNNEMITGKKDGTIINIYKGDPLLQLQNNELNFVNPACYINPEENNCDKNYLFKKDSKEELIKFLNYKPFKFKHLKLQKIFNIISVTFLLLSIICSIFVFILWIKKNPSSN